MSSGGKSEGTDALKVNALCISLEEISSSVHKKSPLPTRHELFSLKRTHSVS